MHILITRPHDDGVVLQNHLSVLGLQATLAPVLDLTFSVLTSDVFAHSQALIATSRNGLKSLEHNQLVTGLASKPLWTVGDATAGYAKSVGFQKVFAGPGTAQGLAKQILERCAPNAGALHHVGGAHLAFDLKGTLTKAGFQVDQTVAYRTNPISAWPDHVVQRIRRGEINGVILMSARTAEAFATLVKAHGLQSIARQMTVFCLSQAVKDKLLATLPDMEPNHLQISEKPDLEELLALVAGFAPK